MPWVKLSDNHTEDARWRKAGPLALALDTAALCYCNRNTTDGVIDKGAAMATAIMVGFTVEQIEPTVAALIAHGFWTEDGDGYALAGYLDHQPSAEDVQRQRATDRERQDRNRRHGKGDHSKCDPQRCWSLNGTSRRDTGPDTGRRTGVSPAFPSRPDPSRPDPKGGTDEEETEDARASVAGAPSRAAASVKDSRRPASGPPAGTVLRLPDGKRVTA